MNAEQRVLDDIDALVDEQLDSGEPTGYDHGTQRCRCGADWHGLPRHGCPGTGFEGPRELHRNPPRHNPSRHSADDDPIAEQLRVTIAAVFDFMSTVLGVPFDCFDIDQMVASAEAAIADYPEAQ